MDWDLYPFRRTLCCRCLHSHLDYAGEDRTKEFRPTPQTASDRGDEGALLFFRQYGLRSNAQSILQRHEPYRNRIGWLSHAGSRWSLHLHRFCCCLTGECACRIGTPSAVGFHERAPDYPLPDSPVAGECFCSPDVGHLMGVIYVCSWVET